MTVLKIWEILLVTNRHMGGANVRVVFGGCRVSGLGGDSGRTDRQTDGRTDATAKFLGTASNFP
jgi:hypothetical protein